MPRLSLSMEIRWDWIVDHLDDIALAVWQHILLTAMPLAIGFAISLGLAIWAMRKPWVYGPVTTITGILYTIPSLAAFALLVPVFGFSLLTALIPLTTYTLADPVPEHRRRVPGGPARGARGRRRDGLPVARAAARASRSRSPCR